MSKVKVVLVTAALCLVIAGPARAVGDPAPDQHGLTTAGGSQVPSIAQGVTSSPTPTQQPSAAAQPGASPEPTASPLASSSTGPAAQPSEEATQRALEAGFAKGEGKAADLHGVADSLYKGKWFSAKAEDKRRCIVRKETGGNYESVSSGGDYRGAYQMSRPLAVGAAWMMQAEVRKEFGAEAVATVEKLRDIPTQKWNRYWQDRAFWTIWRNGSGSDHWRVRGC